MSKPCEDRCLEHPTWVCEREDGHDGLHLAIAAGAWRDDGVAVPFVVTGPESVESGLADAKLVLAEMLRAHEDPALKARCRAALEAVLVVERSWRRAAKEGR